MHLAVLPLAGGEGLLAHSIRGEPATFDRLVLVCTAVEWWERHQVELYLAAIAVGAVVGLLVPAVADPLESAINPGLDPRSWTRCRFGYAASARVADVVAV